MASGRSPPDHEHMDNADLILILGLGIACVALAVVLPGHPRATWLPLLLGIIGAVLGLLAVLTVALR